MPPVVTVTTRSAAETEELGRRLAGRLGPGDIVALIGELGIGKTVLARGIAGGAGAAGYVASPTFTLIREYSGPIPVYHVDLYRLTAAEAGDLGLEELVERGITVIEWAERAPALLRSPLLQARLAFGEAPDERVITLAAEGEGPERALAAVDRGRRTAAGR